MSELYYPCDSYGLNEMTICVIYFLFGCYRSNSAVFGKAPSDGLGADVASDSRARANEHALHLAGRPGQLQD